jgi:hypothetical protein
MKIYRERKFFSKEGKIEAGTSVRGGVKIGERFKAFEIAVFSEKKVVRLFQGEILLLGSRLRPCPQAYTGEIQFKKKPDHA